MRRGLWIIVVIGSTLLFELLGEWGVLAGDCRAADGEYTVVTQHTILIFNAVEDMAAFNKALNYPGDSSLSGIFTAPGAKEVETELVQKIDLLFVKVQQILDMRKEMRKIRVRLFSNDEQLAEAYKKIFKQKINVRGWYVYEFNTVFLNVKDVHEGMLAHELGHAVINHFLTVQPPRATAEILAKYVDKHLFDEVKKY